MRTGHKPILMRPLLAGMLLAAVAVIPTARAADGLPPIPVSPTPSDPMPVLPAASAPVPAAKENLAALENHVMDQAKAAAKHLSALDDVNLDDLNTARMAITKIDTLIDIEKRLVELDKVRDEREGKTTLAAAIPASALSAPPMMSHEASHSASAQEPKHMTEIKPAVDKTPDSIVQISGANGNYIAVIKSEGQDKTVRIGDHLPDGNAVVNITPTSVSLMHEGAVHQIRVSGVDVVYGRSY